LHPPSKVVARGRDGVTLIELSIAVAILGILLVLAVPATSVLDEWSLARAARLAEGTLTSARLTAIAHRRKLLVRARPGGVLETVDPAGAVLARLDLAASGVRAIDSVRLRPAAVRYNPRGHGSAGSIYLYRGRRGIRVVSNFVGRIRRHSFRF